MKTWKTDKIFFRVRYECKKSSTYWTPKGNVTKKLKGDKVLHVESEEAARHTFNSLQGGNFVNLYNILSIEEILPFKGDFGT